MAGSPSIRDVAGARGRLGGHGQQRPQPARDGRAERPASGCWPRSPSSGFVRNESARHLRAGAQPHDRPASCSTSPTRSSPTSPAASRRSRTPRAWPSSCATPTTGRPRRPLTSTCWPSTRVQGVLITPTPELVPRARRRCATAASPVVLVDRRAAGADQCAVAVDDVARRPAGRRPPARAGPPADRLRRRRRRTCPRCGSGSPGVRPRVARGPGDDDARRSSSPQTLTVAGGRRGRRADHRAARRPAAHRRLLRQRPARPRAAAGDGPARRAGARGPGDRRLRRHRLRRRGRRAAVVGAQAAARCSAARPPSCCSTRRATGRPPAPSSCCSSPSSSSGSRAWSDRTDGGRWLMKVALFATCLVDTLYPAGRPGHRRAAGAAGPRGRRPAGADAAAGRCTSTPATAARPCRSSPTTCAPSAGCGGDRGAVRVVRRPRSTTSRPPSPAGPGTHALADARRGSWRRAPTSCREFLVDVLGRRPTSARTTRTGSPTTRPATRCGCCGWATGRCGCCAPCAGMDLVELPAADQCCGFGGTFAVKNADTSTAMLADKMAQRAVHRRRGAARPATRPA